jgi:hypothetical protein
MLGGMSRKTNDKAVENYIFEMMPKDVQEAREAALHNLYYGASEPDEDIGMTWATASKIVEDWWDENGRFELVVDDAGGVSDKHEFDKWIESLAKERYRDAMQEATDDPAAAGIDIDEETGEPDERDIERYAEKQAQYEADANQENSVLYEDRDVRKLILTSEWP